MAVTAVCVLVGSLIGSIILQQQGQDSVHVTGEITQLLPAGDHGFHIHKYGDIRNGCLNASSHYNPFNKQHGGPEDEDRHVGDFGNIVADQSGRAVIDKVFKGVTLEGQYSVLGRAIVVHEKKDDLGRGGNEESKKTGNAGPRLGCCVIGLTESD